MGVQASLVTISHVHFGAKMNDVIMLLRHYDVVSLSYGYVAKICWAHD